VPYQFLKEKLDMDFHIEFSFLICLLTAKCIIAKYLGNEFGDFCVVA
jgi:hypothetical protein